MESRHKVQNFRESFSIGIDLFLTPLGQSSKEKAPSASASAEYAANGKDNALVVRPPSFVAWRFRVVPLFRRRRRRSCLSSLFLPVSLLAHNQLSSSRQLSNFRA